MNHWKGKVVLITGGSAGLGLYIAQAFAQRSATVVIVGRDDEKLRAAVKRLTADRPDAEGIQGINADVTREDDVLDMIQRVKDDHGRLDVLVNNVGRSTRGKVLETTPEDYQNLMEYNFLTTVRCTRAAMPDLIRSDGHLVNIGSLSAKTVSPYLSAYAASKFAVAAYTAQLRFEGPENVHVMLVCPGPLSRDDAGGRYDHQTGDLPEKARQPGAGAKIKLVSPEKVATAIVRGCERRYPELVMPGKTRILFAVAQLWPSLGDWILRKWT